eukprot:333996-Pelagomonas_calceolata.AAC.6
MVANFGLEHALHHLETALRRQSGWTCLHVFAEAGGVPMQMSHDCICLNMVQKADGEGVQTVRTPATEGCTLAEKEEDFVQNVKPITCTQKGAHWQWPVCMCLLRWRGAQ